MTKNEKKMVDNDWSVRKSGSNITPDFRTQSIIKGPLFRPIVFFGNYGVIMVNF